MNLKLGISWLIACLALTLAGQPLYGQSAPEGVATLRGELVRFPDATVNISIFSPDIRSVPSSLWDRIAEVRGVAFLGEGSPEVNDALHAQVSAPAGVGRVRIVDDAAELDPVGVQVTTENRIRLAWYGLDEEEGVAILADGSEADELFTLRILIPNPTDTADWWGLQAALSQAGIRRVQILSGTP